MVHLEVGSMRSTSIRLAAAAAGLFLAAGVVAGCGAGPSSKSDGAGSAPAADGAAKGAPNTNPNPEQAPARSGQAPGTDQPPLERSVIRTGSMTIEAANILTARNKVSTIATGNRGEIASENTGTSDDGKGDTAELVVRVPTSAYDATVKALQGVGKPKAIQQNSSDVTDQVVDVNSRIATQRAGLARIRTLLSKATTIGEIITVESELTRRESELESLLARQKALAGQTEMATVTVTLVQPGEAPPAPVPDQRGFLHGLSKGWHAFTASTAVALTVVGALLPFAITAALIAVPVLWFVRRSRRTAQPVVVAPE
jgi:hypothetical protein